MSIDNIFDDLKKNFTIRKKVDFDDLGIHIELETPTASEEIKITEACKNLDGVAYIEGLKKHSLAYAVKHLKTSNADIEISNNMEFEVTNDDGNKETLTKYLYMLRQIESWPSALRDSLFDAFSNLQTEVEEKVKKGTKFERFEILPKATTEEKESKFKKVEKPEEEETSGMTETEKTSKKAKEEIENIDANTFRKEQDAISKKNG